jgi:alkanesulfonate monooxygenase SsuD/methylene tetrahydromethanopterin reductase-like flavin-dependent oxidoreductase (luciferase family)
MPDDAIEALMVVVAALEKLNIEYVVGGSYASSAHGEARSTNDIDILAAISVKEARALAAELREKFYADELAIEHAIKAKKHFNVIDTDTMFKVDIFPSKRTEFEKQQLNRRQIVIIDPESQATAYVATAEDTILAKLAWYRLGGEVSEQQWRDILGVLKRQRERLDFDYLRRWADDLAVSDLLIEAFADAGIGG